MRDVVTPNSGHLSSAQRKTVTPLIAQLAARLAGDDGQPRFGAVHAMLQRRFNVVSYLLIPTEKFADVMGFIRQQLAINRSRLRRRNPSAYQSDYVRVIHTCRAALGWDKSQLYAFASEKLALKNPLTSVIHLGSNQLKFFADAMRHASRKKSVRTVGRTADAED